VNLIIGRAHRHRVDIVEKALEQIRELNVDHLVVTGDVTNLSLPSEFELAAEILQSHGTGESVSVVPGNHDNYTRGAARKRLFDLHFQGWMESALPDLQVDGPFPYVKVRDGYAVIGLSSSVPSPPIFATGRVSRRQLQSLETALDHDDLAGKFKVVLVHHPLGIVKVSRLHSMRRLVNADELRAVLLRGKADLVLHGHNHRSAFHELERPDGGVLYVSEAGSTSTIDGGNPRHSGKFNLYDFSANGLEQVRCFAYDGESQTFVKWKTRTPNPQ